VAGVPEEVKNRKLAREERMVENCIDDPYMIWFGFDSAEVTV
jgi:hypothetical protein